jgi:hypothetical protein
MDRDAAELTLAMADLEANHGRYVDALLWLEVHSERMPLPDRYLERQRVWLREARRGSGLAPRRARRRRAVPVPPELT